MCTLLKGPEVDVIFPGRMWCWIMRGSRSFMLSSFYVPGQKLEGCLQAWKGLGTWLWQVVGTLDISSPCASQVLNFQKLWIWVLNPYRWRDSVHDLDFDAFRPFAFELTFWLKSVFDILNTAYPSAVTEICDGHTRPNPGTHSGLVLFQMAAPFGFAYPEKNLPAPGCRSSASSSGARAPRPPAYSDGTQTTSASMKMDDAIRNWIIII